MKEKTKIGGIHLSNFKIFYKAKVMKDTVILVEEWTHRSMNRTENPEIDLYQHAQLIFGRCRRNSMEER